MKSMPSAAWIGWVAAILLLPLPALAAEKPQPVATAEQIRDWVRALDSDIFLEREEATEHLIGSGKPAVDELAQLDLPAQNLEVLSRGIHVLQQLALADDLKVEVGARTLLEQLAESKNITASRRASATLSALNGLRQERTIAQLKELNVRVSIHTTQVGIALIQEVPTVEIDETFSGTPEDLERLKYLEDVRLVQLAGEKIDDKVLAQVAKIKSLQYLKIKWAKITNDGLEPFAKLPELQHVSVLYSPIDDGAIETLAKIKTLANVRLYGTKATPAAAARLNVALGGGDGLDLAKKVDYRYGAFLGIGGDKHVRGCAISIVQPNSVAQKVGLQMEDIVVKFDGHPISDFEELTATIGKYKPHDTVKIEYLRGSETRNVEVTLGEWDW